MLETFIIMGIVTPIKPHYSLARRELFKNIIPNLDLEINLKFISFIMKITKQIIFMEN